MQTPLGEHIRRLEDRLMLLNQKVMENSASHEHRNQIEAEIRAVNLALTHYRAALAIEQTVQLS